MAELGLNPFSAAKRAGLGQDYVRDLLRGKVKHPSASKLRALAIALQCSSDYLLGDIDELGEAPLALEAEARPAKIPVSKLIRNGFYQRGSLPRPKGDQSFWVIAAGYDVDEWLELVDDAQLLGSIPAGALLHVVDPSLFYNGLTDILVVEETRGEGLYALVERSVRKVEFNNKGAKLSDIFRSFRWDDLCSDRGASVELRSPAAFMKGDEIPLPVNSYFRVVGLVLRTYQFYDHGEGVENPF